MTNFKAIIVADAHIGADKFGVSPERWDAPVRQAFEYAVESKADVVISCGDFMDKRNPTIAQLLRRRQLLDALGDIPFFEADGNHDRPNAEGSPSALEIDNLNRLFQDTIDSCLFKGVNLIGLPWPRPVDYLNTDEMKMGIDEKIMLARERICESLSRGLAHNQDKPVILFGHAMLAYGPNHDDPKDPGLILGKDVVLPYQAFIDAGLTQNQIFMGHVHDPSALGYVGSTQPTDWSDAEHDKSFVELVIVDDSDKTKSLWRWMLAEGFEVSHTGDYAYGTKKHSYTDQIRLHDIVLEGTKQGEPRVMILDSDPIDVARVTLNLGPDDREDEAAIRQVIDNSPNYVRLDRVIINHPKREAARVETEVAMADMPASEVFELWMKQAGYSAEEAKAPYKEFESLIETSK